MNDSHLLGLDQPPIHPEDEDYDPVLHNEQEVDAEAALVIQWKQQVDLSKAHTLIVTVGEAATAFSLASLNINTDTHLVASMVSSSSSSSTTSSASSSSSSSKSNIWPTKNVIQLYYNNHILLVQMTYNIPVAQIYQTVKTILELVSVDAKVLVLDTLAYRTCKNIQEEQASKVYTHSLAYLQSNVAKYNGPEINNIIMTGLQSPEYIQGISAAILTQCQLSQRWCRVIVNTNPSASQMEPAVMFSLGKSKTKANAKLHVLNVALPADNVQDVTINYQYEQDARFSQWVKKQSSLFYML